MNKYDLKCLETPEITITLKLNVCVMKSNFDTSTKNIYVMIE